MLYLGVLIPHKWENAMTIDKNSWGFRRNAVLSEYLTLAELVKELVITVSCNGNLLMNVGPTKDGIISPIYEERLRGMGNLLYLIISFTSNQRRYSFFLLIILIMYNCFFRHLVSN